MKECPTVDYHRHDKRDNEASSVGTNWYFTLSGSTEVPHPELVVLHSVVVVFSLSVTSLLHPTVFSVEYTSTF